VHAVVPSSVGRLPGEASPTNVEENYMTDVGPLAKSHATPVPGACMFAAKVSEHLDDLGRSIK